MRDFSFWDITNKMNRLLFVHNMCENPWEWTLSELEEEVAYNFFYQQLIEFRWSTRIDIFVVCLAVCCMLMDVSKLLTSNIMWCVISWWEGLTRQAFDEVTERNIMYFLTNPSCRPNQSLLHIFLAKWFTTSRKESQSENTNNKRRRETLAAHGESTPILLFLHNWIILYFR